MLLRAPLPEGWQIESVRDRRRKTPLIDGDTVELSGRNKPLTVRFSVTSVIVAA